MDANASCQLPRWTETTLVSTHNTVDDWVLTHVLVSLDRCAFNHEPSKQIPCSIDGYCGMLCIYAKTEPAHEYTAATAPRRHVLDPISVQSACLWTATTVGYLLFCEYFLCTLNTLFDHVSSFPLLFRM